MCAYVAQVIAKSTTGPLNIPDDILLQRCLFRDTQYSVRTLSLFSSITFMSSLRSFQLSEQTYIYDKRSLLKELGLSSRKQKPHHLNSLRRWLSTYDLLDFGFPTTKIYEVSVIIT